jgi:uncharacterized protein (UPF0335 family)
MSSRLNLTKALVAGIQYMERVDRQVVGVQEEIAELKAQIKELKGSRKAQMAELKADGFDPPGVEQMIRERKMDPDLRRRFHGTLQTYRAMLGMLDGTPLGEAARRAFEEEAKANRPHYEPELPMGEAKPPEERQEPEDSTGRKGRRGQADDAAPTPAVEAPPPAPAVTPEAIAKAKEEGAAAARAGESVTDNRYPGTAEELRAAWDEGWCSELGSDGMDIPEAFRRPEAPDAKPGSGGDDNAEGE